MYDRRNTSSGPDRPPTPVANDVAPSDGYLRRATMRDRAKAKIER